MCLLVPGAQEVRGSEGTWDKGDGLKVIELSLKTPNERSLVNQAGKWFLRCALTDEQMVWTVTSAA